MKIHSVHALMFTLLALLVSIGVCKVPPTMITSKTNHTSPTTSTHAPSSTGLNVDNSTSWPTVNATTPSPKTEADNPPKKNLTFETISAEELNEIKVLCADGHCMNQSAASIARRAYVKQLWMHVLQWTSPYNTNDKLAASKAEAYMHKSFTAKYVRMRLFGFPAKLAMPSDDGIFEGDVMLPEFATDAIIRNSSSFASELRFDPIVHADEGDRYHHHGSHEHGHEHHGRPWYSPWWYAQMEEPSVRADEQSTDVTWSSTVYYHLDKNIGKSDRAVIIDAINTIANATSCLSFIARSNVSENEFSDTIVFSKMPKPKNASSPILSCTLSTLGNLPVNFVFANFSCQNIKGELLHAIMHTLGAVHEHNRADRNEHLSINWSKLSPNKLNYFVLDRLHSVLTFGTPFDFGSIMSYPSTIAVAKAGDESMTPKNVTGTQPSLGQRGRLSCADEQLLRRIYCCSQACADRKGICGLWASTGECASKSSWFWMSKNCPRSCDRCCKNECSPACADHCAEQARAN